MNKDIQLINPQLYKNNPNVIQDLSYLNHNLGKIALKFNDYPENIRSNPLFIYEYFSKIRTDKKEYKYIPTDFLKNGFFISACLERNPDIYLMADPSCHTPHAFLSIQAYHPNSYLKYASESDLNNLDFCLKALDVSYNNYRYLPEKLKTNKNIILKAFSKSFSSQACAKDITKFIPNVLIEDRLFVIDLLRTNIHIFSYLPEKYKDDLEIAFNTVTRNTAFFENVSERLKNDEMFVNNLFAFKDDCTKNFNFRVIENFNSYDILKALPNKYFTEFFCEENALNLRNIYKDLNKIVRNNLEILKAIYNYDSSKNNNSQLYESSFLNKIPDEALRGNIKKFCKEYPKTSNYYKDIQPHILKLIESYDLQIKLEANLNTHDFKKKTMKI